MEELNLISVTNQDNAILTADHKRQIFICLNKMLFEEVQNSKDLYLKKGESGIFPEETIEDLISRLNSIFNHRKRSFLIQDKRGLLVGLKEFQSMINEIGPDDLTFINHRIKLILSGSN